MEASQCDKLKKSWEAYLQIPLDAASRQNKCSKLESFLQCLLKVLSSDDDLPNFSDMHSVCSILAGELLVDVHRVCADCGDDPFPLQRYLLRGRGALLLTVLNTLQLQGVSCGRELAEVLVSILPHCLKFHFSRDDQHSTELSLGSMEASISQQPSSLCIRHPVSRQRAWTSKAKKVEKFRHNNGYRKSSSQLRSMGRFGAVSSDSDVDSGVSTRCRSETLGCGLPRVGLTQSLFVRSKNDDHDEDTHLSLTPVQLCLLLLSITNGLCYAWRHGSELCLAATLAPQLAQLLKHLQDETTEFGDGWSSEDVVFVERHLVRVVVSLLSAACCHVSCLALVQASDCVAVLLDVCRICLSATDDAADGKTNSSRNGHVTGGSESNKGDTKDSEFNGVTDSVYVGIVEKKTVGDVADRSTDKRTSSQSFKKCQNGHVVNVFRSDKINSVTYKLSNVVKKSAEDKMSSRRDNVVKQLWLATDILQGLLLLVARVFSNVLSQPATRASALGMLAKLLRLHGLSLVEQALLKWQHWTEGSAEGLVCALSRLITAMKMTKQDHAGELHHHSDMLRVWTGSDGESCALAVLGEFLLALLPHCYNFRLASQVLACVSKAGLCCCVQPARVMSAFLDPTPLRWRHLTLSTLSSVMLHQLGGGDRACAVCRDSRPSRLLAETRTETSDSAFSGSEASGVEDTGPVLPRWQCLAQLQPLVCQTTSDDRTPINVMRHVLRLVAEGGVVMRAELLQQLFLPVLQRGASLPDKVMRYCLGALPLLLTTSRAHNCFLNCGGARQLVRLVGPASLRPSALRVFQALILLQDDHADKTVLTSFLDMIFSDNVWRLIGETSSRQEPYHPDAASEEIRCDLWQATRGLFRASRTFRRDFLQRGGSRLAHDLLIKSLQELSNQVPVKEEEETEGKSKKMEHNLSLLTSSLDVCLTCCTEKALFDSQELHTEDIVHLVKNAVKQSRWFIHDTSGTLMWTVCETLLSCASSEDISSEPLHRHRFLIMHLRRDDDEDENDKDSYQADVLNDSTSSSSSACQESEERLLKGYDADTEFTSDDLVADRPAERRRGLRGAVPCHLRHPQLCRLMLQLLSSWQWDAAGVSAASSEALVTHVMFRLITLAKQSTQATNLLYTQGVVEILLTHFKHVFLQADVEDRADSHLVMQLFLQLSQPSFTSAELKAFLALFKEENPPLSSLLGCMLHLLLTFPCWPAHSVPFPVMRADRITDLELSVRSLSSDVLTASFRHIASSLDGSVDALYDGSDVSSGSPEHVVDMAGEAHGRAPLHVTLRDRTLWPTGNRGGFAVSLWLALESADVDDDDDDSGYERKMRRRREKANSRLATGKDVEIPKARLPPRLLAAMQHKERHWSNKCLHLLSVGNNQLLFEVWSDTRSASLVFRIVSQKLGMEKCLCETAIHHLLAVDRWQHLTISYSESTQAGHTRGSVRAIVDGCFQKEASLQYSYDLASGDTDSHLMLGHAVTMDELVPQAGSWQVGNLMLFKDAVLTKHASFHLFALGADNCTLSACDWSVHAPNYARHIQACALAQSGLSHDVFTGAHTIYLQHLRENLVASYSAKQAQSFSLYNQPSPYGSRPDSPGPRVASRDLVQQPTNVPARLLTDVAPTRHCGLADAVDQIGGIGVFLCLFAKVVEAESTSSQQTQAVRLLFALIAYHPRYEHDFLNMDGYGLLVKVLLTPRCFIGYELLSVLLDVCVTEPLLERASDGSYRLAGGRGHALIRNVNVLSEILLCWRVWQRADEGVWQLAMQALVSLVSAEHPQHVFNTRQMHNAQVVQQIANICLERIQEGLPSPSLAVCSAMAQLVHWLVGYPPDVHVVITVCDLLLLIHPAASAFVFHTAESFYFTDKSERVTEKPLSTQQPSEDSPTSETPRHPEPMTSTPIKTLVHSQSETRVTTVEPDNCDGPEAASWCVTAGNDQHALAAPRQRVHSYPPVGLLSTGKIGKEPVLRLDAVNAAPSSSGEEEEEEDEERHGTPVSNVHFVFSQSTDSEPASPLMRDEATFEDPFEADDNDGVHCPASMLASVTLVNKDGETTPSNLIKLNGALKSENSDGVDSGLQKSDVIDAECYGGDEATAEGTNATPSADQLTRTDTSDTMKADDVTDTSSSWASISLTAKPSNLLHTSGSKMADLAAYMSSGGTSGDKRLSSPSPGGRRVTRRKWTLPLTEMPASSSSDEENKPAEIKREAEREMECEAKRKATSDDWVVYDNAHCSGIEVLDTLRGDCGGREADCVDATDLGFVQLTVDLMDLLCQVLVTMPESGRKTVMDILLKPEVLLVMAHHNAPQIRVAIVKLLDMYLHRASLEQLDGFLKMHGFHLLANQLHRHQTSRPLVGACATIMLGRPQNLDGGRVDLSSMSDASTVQKMAVIPLMALLEGSTTDQALCTDILSLLRQVYENVPGMAMLMMDNGLMAALCNLIYVSLVPSKYTPQNPAPTVGQSSGGLTNGEKGMSSVILQQVEDFFMKIAEKTFSTSGVYSYQHFEDSLTRLLALQRKLAQLYGIDSVEVAFMCRVQTTVYSTILRYISADDLVLSSGTESMLRNSGGTSGDTTVNPGALFGTASDKSLGQGELLNRVKKVVVLAVNFLIYTEPECWTKCMYEFHSSMSIGEDLLTPHDKFSLLLLDFLANCIILGMERNFFQQRSTISHIMWQGKDLLRIQFSRLLTHLLAPTQVLQLRIATVELIANKTKRSELMKLVINIGTVSQKLVYYLYELLWRHLNAIARHEREDVNEMLNVLQHLGLSPYRLGSKVTDEQLADWVQDEKLWAGQLTNEKQAWKKKTDTTADRVQQRLSGLQRRVSGDAMQVTQTVNNAQNAQRRKFVEHVKSELTRTLLVKRAWQQLIQQLSHERAVWHCAKSHPRFWQLDPTEGPSRVRKRMQCCHLEVESKFLLPKYRDKLDTEQVPPPLAYLFDSDHNNSDSTALLYKLHTSENIQHTCMCSNVTPCSETSGALLIGQSDVYFVADEALMDANYTQVLLGNKDMVFLRLPHEDVKEVHRRRYQLRDSGLEIFLNNGETCLFAFATTKERDELHSCLISARLASAAVTNDLAAARQAWLQGTHTNFDYLTQLNTAAGRSFNDLMQYPVFPFILAAYNTHALDLDDSASYRILSKPISVQNKERETKYIDNYKWLEREKKKADALGEEDAYRIAPYHYGSHYSNSGTVLHFLVRLPPFSQMFLEYQDNNFDLPDRTFHSVETAWRLASSESSTDVKELIPEFFFLPEFFCNAQGFDFGVRQTGERVHGVTLPPWCGGDSRLFTLVHRQALESEHVRRNLASWIDLVFGYKQTGRPAVESINVFHPATYFGVSVDNIADPLKRKATQAMINTYGQMPKQLYRTAHPVPASRPSNRAKTQVNHSLSHIRGLQWGTYVGSPAVPDPTLTWLRRHGSMVSSLVALPTGEVFGVGPSSHLLVIYSKQRGVAPLASVDVLWAAIISWDHPDSVIRLRNRTDMPAINLMCWNAHEQVTCAASVPDCRLLFLAGTSGVITVFNTKFNPSKASHLQVLGHCCHLYGHTGAITALHVCKPFSIFVSASHDATCIIWDLNRLTYVRSITDHDSCVHAVCVSDTLGDIASVSHTGLGSRLMLHTVNAQLVGSVACEQLIHCVTFSNAPEGRSINVIAGGLSSGVVRLWSSWDLSVIKDIHCAQLTRPIVCVTFSPDAQRLFVANTDGTVAVWETPGMKSKEVVFIPFL